MKKCPKCSRQYAKAHLVEVGPSKNACLLDAWDLKSFWRRKIFWRLSPPFHSGVIWSTQPCVPLSAFLANFSEDWDEAVYKTYTVQTHVKLLETTRAIEEFCAFSTVNEAEGAGSGKLLASGELLFIVSLMEVTHTVSKAAGARVHFQYGWVELTISGHISRAEGMLEPAQGWDFVEKWVRYQALNILECEMAVDPEMVMASEALLRAEYASKEDFDKARHERSMMVAEHFILPRPNKEGAKHSREHQARAEALHEGFYEMHEKAGSGGGADPGMNMKCRLHACLFVRFCKSINFLFSKC
jgi:hypothetical protein